MKRLIVTVVEDWHPTILGVMAIAAILHFGLPPARTASLKSAGVGAGDRVKIEDCQRIAVGMAEAEVRRILRVPGEQLTLLERQSDCAFLTRWYGDGFQFF